MLAPAIDGKILACASLEDSQLNSMAIALTMDSHLAMTPYLPSLGARGVFRDRAELLSPIDDASGCEWVESAADCVSSASKGSIEWNQFLSKYEVDSFAISTTSNLRSMLRLNEQCERKMIKFRASSYQ